MFDSTKAKEIYDKASRQQKLDMVRVIIDRRESSALDFVLDVLAQEQDVFIISALVKAAGILGERRTISSLQPYLGHSDGRVRANAVEGLEAIGDEMGWPLIVPLLNDKDHRVRANAARALLHFDEKEARKLVEELINSPKANARATALYFLRTVKVSWAETLLWSFIEKERQPDLHRLACGLLAENGTSKSVEFLERMNSQADEVKTRAYVIALSALKRRVKDQPEPEPFAIEDDEKMTPELTSVATIEPPRRSSNRRPSSLTNSQWQVVQKKEPVSASWKAFAPILLGGCIMAVAGVYFLGRGAPKTSNRLSRAGATAVNKSSRTKVKKRKSTKNVKPSYIPARQRSQKEVQRRRKLSMARRKRLVGRRKARRW